MDTLKNASTHSTKHDGFDNEKFKNLDYSVKSLNRDIESVKKDLTKRVEQIMKSIYFKSDKSDVATLESKILDNLEDLVQNMHKKFSDKTETNENLQILDKQIKNLFELVVNREKTVERDIKPKDEDEAMLSRKPLGGISCASCSKNLNNLCNVQASEHFSWSKLPMRDPSDRISKVGQGFSKMLSSMKNKTIQSPDAMKSHLSTTDLRREEDTHDQLKSPHSSEQKSRNKNPSPFKTFDVAQRTARERKVKRLDKQDEGKQSKGMQKTHLPTIIKSANEVDSNNP